MATTPRGEGNLLGRAGRGMATAAGLAAIGMALYQVASPGPPGGASYETVGDYVRELLFLMFLATSVGSAWLAGAKGLAPRQAGWLVAAGYSLIAFGVAIGLLVRTELEWFFLVAGPGLLLSAAGFVLWAVWALRTGAFPSWACALLGVGGLTAIVLSELGTSVLIGSFWLYLGNRREVNAASTSVSTTSAIAAHSPGTATRPG